MDYRIEFTLIGISGLGMTIYNYYCNEVKIGFNPSGFIMDLLTNMTVLNVARKYIKHELLI